MEWLVRTENHIPADMTAAERERLRAAERARAMELRAGGVLQKLWRTPGRQGTVGLYECRDATHLHDTLSSLPMFPWMKVTVEPLAAHPQELSISNGRNPTAQIRASSEGHDEQPV